LQSVLVIVLLIAINFLLIHLAPGDPVHLLAGQSGDEKYFAFIRAKFGLDKPLATQLWIYLSSVARGDLGYSLGYGQPVTNIVLSRVPATLLLMLSSLLLSSTVGLWLGVESARRAESTTDRMITGFAALCYSMPSFSIGQVLLITFSLYLGLFPAQGMTSASQQLSGPSYWLDVLSHLALPAITLGLVMMAMMARLTRTEMLNVLGEDYITTARSKGLSESRVAYGHALRNALMPLTTLVGNEFGTMLSGAVLVETVFAWPGLGRLMIDSIETRDYPVLMGLFLLVTIGVVVANLITDILYSVLDPRIAHSDQVRA
jgi:ABC-type dipeptide/oligopeptide/nickel transport system permease component